MQPDEKSPRATLALVAEGGEYLAALAMGRLKEAEECLARGEFTMAYERAREAMSKIGPLATAEGQLGGFAETMVIRAEDVQEGMVLTGIGEVLKKELKSEDHGDHEHRQVVFHVAGGEEEGPYAPDQELLLASRSEREA